jgi:hypothetical protein
VKDLARLKTPLGTRSITAFVENAASGVTREESAQRFVAQACAAFAGESEALSAYSLQG